MELIFSMIMNLILVMQEQVLGFEMKSSVYDVNINLYEAMSEIHHVDGAPEVAAGGYDAEVGALLTISTMGKTLL